MLMYFRSPKSLLSLWEAIQESNRSLLDTSLGSFAWVALLFFGLSRKPKFHLQDISMANRKWWKKPRISSKQFFINRVTCLSMRVGPNLSSHFTFFWGHILTVLCLTTAQGSGCYVFLLLSHTETGKTYHKIWWASLWRQLSGNSEQLRICQGFSVLMGTASLCHPTACATNSRVKLLVLKSHPLAWTHEAHTGFVVT